jgi:putative phosphoesterase
MNIKSATCIAVLSDTHGILRPQALLALRAAHAVQSLAAILHLGDVGDFTILETLRGLAPTHAVRGNVDTHGPCSALPPTEYLTFAEKNIYLLHNLDHLDLAPRHADVHAVLHGHTHSPNIEHRDGVLYFNPGSCGPRRFTLPTTLGFLTISDSTITPTLQNLL